MDPVFTLQWPEFLLANRLQKFLPKSQGFSVLVPASRQEKGIDLAVLGVLSQNRRNFRHPSSSPATSASRSIILPSLWKV